jgi:hypothetical protein
MLTDVRDCPCCRGVLERHGDRYRCRSSAHQTWLETFIGADARGEVWFTEAALAQFDAERDAHALGWVR